jgi:hypothetical protein
MLRKVMLGLFTTSTLCCPSKYYILLMYDQSRDHSLLRHLGLHTLYDSKQCSSGLTIATKFTKISL